MAKFGDVQFDQWDGLIDDYQNESDRGAVLLAGSFVDSFLGQYLRHRMEDKKFADNLLRETGVLGSFAARISVARAFGFINTALQNDLHQVKEVRNFFAHNPLHATFKENSPRNRVENMSLFGLLTKAFDPEAVHRYTYLCVCGTACANFHRYITGTTGALEIISLQSDAKGAQMPGYTLGLPRFAR